MLAIFDPSVMKVLEPVSSFQRNIFHSNKHLIIVTIRWQTYRNEVEGIPTIRNEHNLSTV